MGDEDKKLEKWVCLMSIITCQISGIWKVLDDIENKVEFVLLARPNGVMLYDDGTEKRKYMPKLPWKPRENDATSEHSQLSIELMEIHKMLLSLEEGLIAIRNSIDI